MCQFSVRFFPMSFFPTNIGFLLWVFSLDSCRASMNLNQTFILAPGTVMHYDCAYMHSMSSFAHIWHLKQSKSTFKSALWMVNGCACGRVLDSIYYIVAFPALPRFPSTESWAGPGHKTITSLISDNILYAQARPHNVLHFLVCLLSSTWLTDKLTHNVWYCLSSEVLRPNIPYSKWRGLLNHLLSLVLWPSAASVGIRSQMKVLVNWLQLWKWTGSSDTKVSPALHVLLFKRCTLVLQQWLCTLSTSVVVPVQYMVGFGWSCLASYPGSRWTGKRRAWYPLFVHVFNFAEILGDQELLCYICTTVKS